MTHWLTTAANNPVAPTREAWKYTNPNKFNWERTSNNAGMANTNLADDRISISPPETVFNLGTGSDSARRHPVGDSALTFSDLTANPFQLTSPIATAALTADVAGYELTVPSQTDCASAPLFINHSEPNSALHISAEADSQFNIIEVVSAESARQLTQFDIARGAKVQHLRIIVGATAGLGRTQVTQAAGSTYTQTLLQLANTLDRQELEITSSSEETHSELHHLNFAAPHNQQDLHLTINHTQPHTTSTVRSYQLAASKAKAIFQGCFKVAKPAQQTDADMLVKNLLLGEKAEAISKPELEIFADDVQCHHGSATGALSADELFYLQARGLAPEAARQLLLQGFVQQSLAALPSTLRPWVMALIQPQLENLHSE